MAERYFLICLIALTVFGSAWLSFVTPLISYGIFLASLLALLGLASVATASSANKASILMPLFFTAAIAYEVYLYLNGRFGYILVSILLLSLVGLILGFGVSKAQKPAKAARQAHHTASASPPQKIQKKKAPRRRAGKRRKKVKFL